MNQKLHGLEVILVISYLISELRIVDIRVLSMRWDIFLVIIGYEMCDGQRIIMMKQLVVHVLYVLQISCVIPIRFVRFMDVLGHKMPDGLSFRVDRLIHDILEHITILLQH